MALKSRSIGRSLAAHVQDVVQLVGCGRGSAVARVAVEQAEVVVLEGAAGGVPGAIPRTVQRPNVDVRVILVTLTLAGVHRSACRGWMVVNSE